MRLSAATASGRAGLAAILDDPKGAALAFDFDGVLAPIVEDPDAARIHPRARAALMRLTPLVGSVAVISGRPAATVVAYGDLSDLAVFGHYGRERWDPRTGQVVAPPVPAGVASARAELPVLLATLPLPAGVAVEDKGGAVAVHTRRSADPTGALSVLRGPLFELAERHGLVPEPGRFVVELRPPGADKGRALRTYVGECSARSVAYAGDDLGDLAAFAAVDALHAEGVPGLKICSGSTEVVELAQRADLVVDGPAGVADLLDSLAAALSGP